MKYTGPVCRLCAREGEKLFLKGTKCYTSKCRIEKRSSKPGMHGQKRPKVGDYSTQLRAKQSIRRVYGLSELQFRNTYKEADRRRGATGENLLHLLESRLDNMVYRTGFGVSRAEARQLVRHKAIKVNGSTVTIPSFQVKTGDEISISDKALNQLRIKSSVKFADERKLPEWVSVDTKNLKAVYKQKPEMSEITSTLQPQLVVEFYSK